MNKLTKRLAAIGAAMTMAVSMMSIGASASSSGSYYLHYSYGAPTSATVVNQSKTLTASGRTKIKIKSTQFSTYISGATCEASCTTHRTSTASINSVSTYYLSYKNGIVPAQNVTVSVNLVLDDYINSRNVSSKGTVYV